ncbi:MAG: effector binding domain-containing protein, partial [Oscillospiraceae bacterium]|nr:effector binding domain-containing protein [Oscillospiraceae bacterium]
HFGSGDGQFVNGQFGICFDHNTNSKLFNYMIADSIEGKENVPDKFTKKEIPAKTWAVFPVKGAMPKALQDVNSEIWGQWVPNCKEYDIDGNINIEMYSCGDTNSDDYYSEIWIPVKKV